MMRRAIAFAVVMLAATAPANAQSQVQRLLSQARQDLADLDADAARTKLIQVLNQTLTAPERARAFTLLAFAELNRDNATAAQTAFERAIGIEPSLRVDSLYALDNKGPRVFADARAITAANAPRVPTFPSATEEQRVALSFSVAVPRDTVISNSDSRYLIGVVPNLPADIVTSIYAADAPNTVVWADSTRRTLRRPIFWPLKNSAGQPVTPGRYVLRVQATDSTGQSRGLDYRLIVAQVQPDTQALPAPLQASAFAPETLSVGKRFARVLLTGGALAAAVVVTPTLLGNSSLNSGLSSDPMSYAVAGGLAVASAVRFVVARRPTQLSAENAQKNRDVRAAWQRNRDSIAQSNAQAIARAGIRVTLEGQ